MRFYCFCLLCFFSVHCIALESSTSNTHEYQLKNGLKLLVVENHQSPVVISSIWYKVGGSYETNGLTGISHMLEHMMFKGTTNHPDGYLKSKIAEIGGDQNAITSNDYTAYYQEIPAKSLDMVLSLEADRMQNLAPTQESFEQEHKVVLEEYRMRIDNNPQGLMWLNYNAAAFVNSPYHQPVIGWLPDMHRYTLSAVKNWYNTWYAPNNAEIIILGDVVPQQVYKQVEKYFGSIPSKQIPVMPSRTEIKSVGTKVVDVNARAELPWAVVGYNVPGIKQLSVDDKWQAYALLVAKVLLSDGDSSRLNKQLVRKQQIAIAASADYSPYELYKTSWTVSSIPTENISLQQLKQALLRQVSMLKTQPVSALELKIAKTKLISSNIYMQDSMMAQMLQLGAVETSGVGWQESYNFAQNVKAVTPQQIQAVAKLYFTKNNLTIAFLHPIEQQSKQEDLSGDNHEI